VEIWYEALAMILCICRWCMTFKILLWTLWDLKVFLRWNEILSDVWSRICNFVAWNGEINIGIIWFAWLNTFIFKLMQLIHDTALKVSHIHPIQNFSLLLATRTDQVTSSLNVNSSITGYQNPIFTIKVNTISLYQQPPSISFSFTFVNFYHLQSQFNHVEHRAKKANFFLFQSIRGDLLMTSIKKWDF